MKDDPLKIHQSVRRFLLLGAAIVILVSFGIGGWAATTELSGAVVAQGTLVVDSNVKKVQHPNGGVISELRVREGDRVKAGDLLVRLDGTQTRANAAIVVKGLEDLTARQARLEAERDNADAIEFPTALLDGALDATGNAPHAVAAERKLFVSRREAREGKKAQLTERISQLREEIQGYAGQTIAKKREIDLIEQELSGIRDLWQKNLIPLNRLTSLEREGARLEGERSQLMGTIAQTKGKITETQLQIIQIDQDLRSDVGKELGEVRSQVSELFEKKIAAEDQLKRIDIRAPQDGVVHQLAVHTVGGVISAGDQIMLIVPDADSLAVEVKIAPNDIDQLYMGQVATLRFSSFNQRTTPEIDGQVRLISADLTQDQRTGVSFYIVRIALQLEEVSHLGNVKLVPGMPVEVFVRTGERTALSYLIKPIREQVSKAFREK
jgi:HlyD family secretion protein